MDRKIWFLSEEEMGSFVMHSAEPGSQRHQQTYVESRAASRSRRLFLRSRTLQRFSQTKAAEVWTSSSFSLQTDWSFTTMIYR